MPPNIASPSIFKVGAFSSLLYLVLFSTPPNTGLALTSTFQSGGTIISTPPKIEVALIIAVSLAIWASLKSSSIPANSAVNFPPLKFLE